MDDRLWDYAGGDRGFYDWLDAVNRMIEGATTLHLLDLPDRLLRDEYDAGTIPVITALDVLAEEGFA